MSLTYARAALVIQVAQARKAFLATGAGDQVALTALREHALAHDAAADRLVARFRAIRHDRQQRNPDGGCDDQHVPACHPACDRFDLVSSRNLHCRAKY